MPDRYIINNYLAPFLHKDSGTNNNYKRTEES